MDFIDIIFYIVLAVVAIFSTFIQKKAEKKAKELEKQQHPESDAGDANAPAPFDIWGDDDDDMYDTVSEEATQIENEKEKEEGLTLDEIFRMLREGTPPPPKPAAKPKPARSIFRRATVTESSAMPAPEPVSFAPKQHPAPKPRITTPLASPSKEFALQSEISDMGVYDECETSSFDTDNVDWRQAVITSEILSRKY